MELIRLTRIGDQAPHSAFTDLCRFRNHWYCAFREASGHMRRDGQLRLLASPDGADWSAAALLAVPGGDLRDPMLSPAPDGRLLLTAALAGPRGHRTLAWRSGDGLSWDGPAAVGEADWWLWRPAWHGGMAYGVAYATAGAPGLRFYAAADGLAYRVRVAELLTEDRPSEAALLFGDDGAVLCLARCDAPGARARLGSARPPYTQWHWQSLDRGFDSPCLLALPDGSILAAGRDRRPAERTVLCRLDPAAARLDEWLTLPSGGDCGYPGLVFHGGRVWMSYYSSHEGRSCVYLARLRA